MTSSNDQFAFLKDFIKLIDFAISVGFKVTFGETMRTPEQQKIYFDTGRSKTMNSRHLVKMAGDLNFFKDNIYINSLPAKQAIIILAPVGHFWESLSPLNRWGGNFDRDWSKTDNWHDVPHFERLDSK